MSAKRKTIAIGSPIAAVAVLAIVLALHVNVQSGPSFREFRSNKYERLLCIDLNDDAAGPRFALIIANPSATTPEWRLHVLPFAADDIQSDDGLVMTQGRAGQRTLVHYLRSPNTKDRKLLRIEAASAQLPNRAVLDRLDPGVYYSRDGLERNFVMVVPAQQEVLPKEMRPLQFEMFDAVAVSLPVGAEGKEIREGLTAIPKALETDGGVRYFASQTVAMSRLEIRYTLSPTAAQSIIAEYGGKLFGAVIVPLTALLFMADAKRQTARRRLIWGGVVFQVVVLVALVVVAILTRGQSGTRLVADLAVAGVGAIFSGVVLWLKLPPAGKDPDSSP